MQPNQPSEQSPADQVQPAAPQYIAPRPTTNPGRTLGIVGFILAFLVSIIGVVLSIIGLVKSHKAGFKNPLAVAGIAVGSVLSVVWIGIIAAIAIVAYNGVQERIYAASSTESISPVYSGIQKRAKTTAASTMARAILKHTEAYNALTGTPSTNNYPKSITQLENSDYPETSLANMQFEQASEPLKSAPTAPETFEFYTCTDTQGGGNKIGHWNYTEDSIEYLYSGPAGPASTCTFVAN